MKHEPKPPLHISKRKQKQIRIQNAQAFEKAAKDKIAAALDEARG